MIVVQDMYNECVTVVTSTAGITNGLQVTVGIHQGSAISPLLFAVLINRLTVEVRQETT